MEAPQWSGSRRGFFLFSTKLSILSTSNRRKAFDRTDGNKKMSIKGTVFPLIFPKSKIQQATRRRHHISLEHLSSPNRPIENKEK